MNKPLLIVALTTLASLSVSAKDKDVPTADQILQAVRDSMVQNDNLNLAGSLRALGEKRHTFRMTIRRNQIAFLFDKAPQQTIVLELEPDRFRLSERMGAKGDLKVVPPQRYGQPIRGTGVNYLDLSLAYLYWPNAKFMGEDVVAERITWKLQIPNPRRDGPYAVLQLWIDQNSGGLMRMQGYNREGRLLKKMEVKKVQKVKSGEDRVWTLEKMSIIGYDPKTRRPISRTYLDL